MDISSPPSTRTVTILTGGFSDGTEASLVLEAADSWIESQTTGDIIIIIAPKPERRYVDDRKRVITIAAQPMRHLVWRSAHLMWFEWNEAQAHEHTPYQPESAA